MGNWMVFDYYLAVRLTANNWIESLSISHIALPSPVSCSSIHPVWFCCFFPFLTFMVFILCVPLLFQFFPLPMCIPSWSLFLSLSFSIYFSMSSCSLSPLDLLLLLSFSFLSLLYSTFLIFGYTHTHTSLLSSALLLLEHSDTVVMVTPIIFWHEWRILYWWDGMAEGEKRRVMERKTKLHRKKEITGRENQNDMEMIIPAAYDTKHFHPVIFLLLIS